MSYDSLTIAITIAISIQSSFQSQSIEWTWFSEWRIFFSKDACVGGNCRERKSEREKKRVRKKKNRNVFFCGFYQSHFFWITSNDAFYSISRIPFVRGRERKRRERKVRDQEEKKKNDAKETFCPIFIQIPNACQSHFFFFPFFLSSLSFFFFSLSDSLPLLKL